MNRSIAFAALVASWFTFALGAAVTHFAGPDGGALEIGPLTPVLDGFQPASQAGEVAENADRYLVYVRDAAGSEILDTASSTGGLIIAWDVAR